VKLATLVWFVCLATGIQAVAADPIPVLVPQEAGPIANTAIGFNEPSGLTFDASGLALWSVSDNSRSVFLMPRESGAITRTLPVGQKQLEGVSVGFDANDLLFVREAGNLILRYDTASRSVTQTVRLSDLKGYDTIAGKFGPGEESKGLEGITIDVIGRRIFVVKEARPRLLIQISPDLSRIEGHWKLTADMGFKVAGISNKKLDISGLAFDPGRQAIWMASDKGGCIFLFDLQTLRGQRVEVQSAQEGPPPDLSGIEGIAISDTHDALFTVSDSGKTSMRFDFSIR